MSSAGIRAFRFVEPVRKRLFSATATEEAYPLSMKLMHWAVGGCALACIGTVQAAMYAKKDYKPVGMSKGELMNLHKSFGLLVAGGIAPRILLRLTSRVPGDLPGNAVEHLAGKVAHFGLYALLFVLPGSGIAMGYFGGKGLPFFGYHIAGAPDDKKDGEVAKNAFKVHKQAGQALEYLTLAHFGATGWHLFKGHSIMRRIVPGMQ